MDPKYNSDSLQTKALRQRETRRESVLIVLHGDGWVELFAERHIAAHIALMPFMESAQGRIEAEQYLEANLPHRFKVLYWPSFRRAADMVRKVRPSDIARVAWNLEFLDAITESGRILRGETETEGKQIWIA